MTKSDAALKRCFDVVVSAIGLTLTFWVIGLAFAAASLSTKTNGFFGQKRVGKDGRIFTLFKIRTMVPICHLVTTVTVQNDPRITRVGSVLRKTKIDELPQLLNVLRGDMSFVGPRPDVPGFADQLSGDDRIILTVRPGITGPATLKYRDEESILLGVSDSEQYNKEVIYPDKVLINRDYIENYGFSNDLKIIWRTIVGA